MRTIKFRAWAYSKRDDRHHLVSDVEMRMNDWNPMTLLEIDGQPVVLMQYTGLLDKNGKEIYEGDIVRDCSHSDMVFVVEWDNEWGGYRMPDGFDEENIYPFSEIECEVIGNIYENPELLTPPTKV